MAKQIDFWTLLKLTQEYVSQHYAAVLTDKTKLGQLKAYVDKYLRDNDYHVENLTTKEPIVDEERGVSVSIRLLHMCAFTQTDF